MFFYVEFDISGNMGIQLGLTIDENIYEKLSIGSKRLGVDVNTLVSNILREWIDKNRMLLLSVDEIAKEYEDSLSSYSEHTQKTKIRMVRSFLEWCESRGIGFDKIDVNTIELFAKELESRYTSKYVNSYRATLRDFIYWFQQRYGAR